MAQSNRSPALDGIRGLAIVLVLLWHYVIQYADLLMPTKDSGHLLYVLGLFTFSGVDLFFVLSGFLIVGILLDNYESSNFLKVFYLRRACRILPLYYGWLILFVIVSKNFEPTPFLNHSFPNIPILQHFLFLQNLVGNVNASENASTLAVTWSLAVEEQFYLVMPFLVLFLSRKMLAGVMFAVLVASPFIRADYQGIASMGNFTRLDGLAWGVLLALAIRSPGLWNALQIRRRMFLTLWWGLVAMMVGLPLFLPSLSPFYSINAACWAGLLFLTVGQPPEGIFQRLLSNRALVFSGSISYGIYLFHTTILDSTMAMMRTFHYEGGYNFLIVGMALILSYLAAWISFNLIEKPIIAWGHRFGYRKAI